MRQLRVLEIEVLGYRNRLGHLSELLRRLAPTLERLSYTSVCPLADGDEVRPLADGDEVRLQVRLPTGGLPHLQVSSFGPAPDFARLALALFEDCRVVAPGGIEVLELLSVTVQDGDSFDGPELRLLWPLIRSCQQVRVGYLGVLSWEDAAQAVRRLGWPEVFFFKDFQVQLDFRSAMRQGHLGQAYSMRTLMLPASERPLQDSGAVTTGANSDSASAAAPDLPVAKALALPSPAALAQAVTQRMVSGAPGPTTQWRVERPRHPALLLRGPLLAALVQVPAALEAWLRWLDAQAAEGAAPPGSPGAVGNGGGGVKCISEYLVIPAVIPAEPVGCVLVQCTTAAGAAQAVAAAAMAAAAGSGLAVTADALEVEETYTCSALQGHHRLALQQELQALWDRHVGCCGADTEAVLGLLKGLMGLWDQLNLDTAREAKL